MNTCICLIKQCHCTVFVLSYALSLVFKTEENLMGMTSFREVLEKMLVIVVLPVRKSLRKEIELFSPHLVSNTCGLLASIVSELTASALGSEVTYM